MHRLLTKTFGPSSLQSESVCNHRRVVSNKRKSLIRLRLLYTHNSALGIVTKWFFYVPSYSFFIFHNVFFYRLVQYLWQISCVSAVNSKSARSAGCQIFLTSSIPLLSGLRWNSSYLDFLFGSRTCKRVEAQRSVFKMSASMKLLVRGQQFIQRRFFQTDLSLSTFLSTYFFNNTFPFQKASF